MVVAESVQRGLRLFREFRVAAVIFALPDPQGAAQVAALDTRVILLAAGDALWSRSAVSVLSRGTDAASL